MGYRESNNLSQIHIQINMKARNPKMPSFRGDVIDGKLKEDKHINFKK